MVCSSRETAIGTSSLKVMVKLRSDEVSLMFCLSLFKTWCSLPGLAQGSCLNGGFGGACDSARCALADMTECLVTSLSLNDLVSLVFPQNEPAFVW